MAKQFNKYNKIKKIIIKLQNRIKFNIKLKKSKKVLVKIIYRYKYKILIRKIRKSTLIINQFYQILKAKKLKIKLKEERRSIKFLQIEYNKLLREKEDEKRKIEEERRINEQEKIKQKREYEKIMQHKKELEEKENEIKQILESQKNKHKELEDQIKKIVENKKTQDEAKIDVIYNLTQQIENLGRQNSMLRRHYENTKDNNCIIS